MRGQRQSLVLLIQVGCGFLVRCKDRRCATCSSNRCNVGVACGVDAQRWTLDECVHKCRRGEVELCGRKGGKS
eukprot:6475442-Amphidinium_carterae.2